MRLRLAEQWDSYARTVLPKNASTVQRWECRRAFYAGAQGIMFGVIAALAPESEPTEEDLKMMDNLQKELEKFAQDVKDGRA